MTDTTVISGKRAIQCLPCHWYETNVNETTVLTCLPSTTLGTFAPDTRLPASSDYILSSNKVQNIITEQAIKGEFFCYIEDIHSKYIKSTGELLLS